MWQNLHGKVSWCNPLQCWVYVRHVSILVMPDLRMNAWCRARSYDQLLCYQPQEIHSVSRSLPDNLGELADCKIPIISPWKNRPLPKISPQISDANILLIISPPEYKSMDCYCYLFWAVLGCYLSVFICFYWQAKPSSKRKIPSNNKPLRK